MTDGQIQSQAHVENVANGEIFNTLPGFIHIDHKESGSYAVYCTGTYVKNGKVYHDRQYLGKVIDEKNGIFYTRSRGYYTFNLTDGYGEVDPLSVTTYSTPQNVVLHFGDVWLVDQILKQTGLDEVLDNLILNAGNTVKSLVAFRLLDSNGYDSVEEWYRTSYARVLYPNAIVTSSMTTKYIEKLGNDAVYNNFFSSYLNILAKKNNISDKISFPILIESTGLPNDIKSYLTSVNNHNGVISNEIRLIYVVDKNTKLPILFRYVPGNIIDNSTFITTINTLITYGIEVELVIMDAGYTSLENLAQLISLNIPFITIMTQNRNEYKILMQNYGQKLYDPENAIFYLGRGLYGKKVEITLCDRLLYAYVILDRRQSVDDEQSLFNKVKDDPDRISKIKEKFDTFGRFILLSSDNHEINDILPLYYNRQTIEQVFDISNNFADILPLRAHSIPTIAGRLLLSFIATIIYSLTSEKLKNYKLCANKALYHLRNLKIKIYESSFLLEELTKIQKEIFVNLNLQCPYPEERGNLLKKDSFLAKLKSGNTRGPGRPKGSKSKKIVSSISSLQSESSDVVRRPRGRPKGSKKVNAHISESQHYQEQKPLRGRGRPKVARTRLTLHRKLLAKTQSLII
jgi:hypothetical protein